MSNNYTDQFAHVEITCGSLLCELQDIWNEVGELDDERDRMLLEIEQECLAIYRRKVAEAKRNKADLHRAISTLKAEISFISSSMRELEIRCDMKFDGSLKEELHNVSSQVEDMRKRKMQRKNQFLEVLDQLQEISVQIGKPIEVNVKSIVIDESDLSMGKLEELRNQLVDFRNEKINRQKLISDHMKTLKSLCLVLGISFKDTIHELLPTLDDSEEVRDVSNKSIERLVAKIKSLGHAKIQRVQKLQDLAISLLELWNLLDTPTKEQSEFQNVTSIVAATEPEITEPNILSINFMKNIEEEVSRLNHLKSTKIKELILKRKSELIEICRETHMVTEALGAKEYSNEALESGIKDPEDLLNRIELQISKVKEEAFGRKDILEKVEKWLAACEEECWLEEYNRDDNRYNAGRGAHLALKRAEKARVLVTKIPGIVEALTTKATAWEEEKGTEFSYDGVRLLSMLEQYSNLRQEKDLERQRQKNQRKLQGQLITEQEALYGARVSPSKSGKKAPRISGVFNNRKLSIGGAMLLNLNTEKAKKRSDGLNQKLRNNTLSNHLSSGSQVHISGGKIPEIAGHISKRLSVAPKGHSTKSPKVRKPLSPIPLSFLSKTNTRDPSPQDNSEHVHWTLKRTPPRRSKSPLATTEESDFTDENVRNPQTNPTQLPTTPSALVPTLMANTPTTPCVYSGDKTVEKRIEHFGALV